MEPSEEKKQRIEKKLYPPILKKINPVQKFGVFYLLSDFNVFILHIIKDSSFLNLTILAANKKQSVPKTAEKEKLIVTPISNGEQLSHQKKKNVNAKKTSEINKNATSLIKVIFQLRYHTNYGQQLFITANHPAFGEGILNKAFPLQYFNEEFWYGMVELPANSKISYNYLLKDEDDTFTVDWGKDKLLDLTTTKAQQVLIIDSWNHAGYPQNVFYTEPFQKILLPQHQIKVTAPKKYTHLLRVKAPLLGANQKLALLGNTPSLNEWNTDSPIWMSKSSEQIYWEAKVDLSDEHFPVAYKYAVYDADTQQFVQYEEGNNRIVYDSAAPKKLTIINDGFIQLPVHTWKGAGVAIPVFSLRSDKSLGVGEFTDIKLLVDWAKQVGLKLIQILPINDTTATHTWMDSYPYAAISAFALHPLYLNVDELATTTDQQADLDELKAALNQSTVVEYPTVMEAKWKCIKTAFQQQKKTIFKQKAYQAFENQNKHWLYAYAVFCYLRDKYKTADFAQWPELSNYQESLVNDLIQQQIDEIQIHLYVQFILHKQLKTATEYAHKHGIIVKGDIPIGIYRYSVDAWMQPALYQMDVQAGAPPDDFAIKGQNWGFPTYNWQQMKKDHFSWWRKRFEQMSYYFDAFRIDHILGFFRIWSIPMHAVEGIMGYFVPAIPVHINEFGQKGIHFDHHRFTKPFINGNVLWKEFGYEMDFVKENFLIEISHNEFELKEAFNTQRKIEQYFKSLETTDQNQKIQQGLYNLVSNVILFEVEGSHAQSFHFRFNMEQTDSFQYLEEWLKQPLSELYIDYFFRRQDEFWKKEALEKLPSLKAATNMLICGEDLGLVPACVPDVMKDLGLLSLEIQRMPKATNTQFFHPNDAPYLSVVTPSTHDMSTIRGWWEEDRQRTQQFFQSILGQQGDAPYFCEAWINKAILLQHLYSPAMWSIFQLQDILGIDAAIRRENPHEERINNPANPNHYWQYRMHLTLENLNNQTHFNTELSSYIKASQRI